MKKLQWFFCYSEHRLNPFLITLCIDLMDIVPRLEYETLTFNCQFSPITLMLRPTNYKVGLVYQMRSKNPI